MNHIVNEIKIAPNLILFQCEAAHDDPAGFYLVRKGSLYQDKDYDCWYLNKDLIQKIFDFVSQGKQKF